MPGSIRADAEAMKGDGSDGAFTTSGDTTFNQLKQFTSLTVGHKIEPVAGSNGLVILVQGTVTVNTGGKITADGFGGAGALLGNNKGGDGFVSNNIFVGAELPVGGTSSIPAGRRSFAQLAALADAGEQLFVAFGGGGGGGDSGGGAGDGGDLWAGGGKGGIFPGDVGTNGGGFVIIFAESIVINAGGEITARGIDHLGTNNGSGGGGGLVYLAQRGLTNNGTISAVGGLKFNSGFDSADGLFTKKTIPG